MLYYNFSLLPAEYSFGARIRPSVASSFASYFTQSSLKQDGTKGRYKVSPNYFGLFVGAFTLLMGHRYNSAKPDSRFRWVWDMLDTIFLPCSWLGFGLGMLALCSSPLLANTYTDSQKVIYTYTAISSGSGTASVTGSSFTGSILSQISITIPTSITVGGINYMVTSIGDSAFAGRNYLKSITIPSSVAAIGRSVFSGCALLQTVNIPS